MKNKKIKKIRSQIKKIIFDSDTTAGKIYDILLILTIGFSVMGVMLDSIASINKIYGQTLHAIEWLFTIIFTFDYIVRLLCVDKPKKYARSFFGLVDLLGVIPTYLGLIFPGTRFLVAIRFLRILRLFRVLKLVAYMEEVRQLKKAFLNSRIKIAVFLFTVLTSAVVLGSLMYVIEGAENGFTSIPRSIYWSIVTLTTVGYGDISPQTPMGQALAALIMILGYSIIVIPTGFVTVEMMQSSAISESSSKSKSNYCQHCGNKL